MKRYIKDGVIRDANKIVITKDGMTTTNPTEEMILADGWVEYVEPEPTPAPDKETRTGLKLRFAAEVAMGKPDTTLWADGVQYPLSLETAIQMLYALEVYASMCYDRTQAHLAAIDAMTTVEEVEAYDHTSGYPEKLKF